MLWSQTWNGKNRAKTKKIKQKQFWNSQDWMHQCPYSHRWQSVHNLKGCSYFGSLQSSYILWENTRGDYAFMRLEYIAKVRDYDDYPCKIFLKDQDHCSINRTLLWTAIFFINTPDRFVMLFSFNYLLCMVLLIIELSCSALIKRIVHIYIYI